MADWLTPEQFHARGETGAQVRKGLVLEKLETDGAADSRRLRFCISTGSVDRDNDIIDPAGWDLSNYLKNPVVLWAHSHKDLPVAKALSVSIENGCLIAVAEFATHAFAETVYQLLKGGFLRATSVGFRALEYAMNEERRGVDFKRSELLEFSVVPVPANAEALALASAKGVDLEPLRKWMADLLVEWPGELRLPGKAWQKVLGAAAVEPDPVDAPVLQQADVAAATTKLESLVATLCERIAAAGDQMAALRSPEAAVDEERGAIPKDVSRTCAASDAEWKAPRLRDFTAEPWAELGATERRRIAGHYGWAAAMPPAAFADLKLAHHSAADGSVVLRGVAAAAARLHQAGIPAADIEVVRAHLAKHYKQFDAAPPWERDTEGWAKYEAGEHEGMPAQVAALQAAGFEAEAKALLGEDGENDAVLELSDDPADAGEFLELADESDDTLDIDPEHLRAVLGTVVRDTVGAIVREATQQTLNRMRGRLD